MLRKSMFVAIAFVILLTSCGQSDKKTISVPERARLSEQTNPHVAQATNAFGLELAGRIMHNNSGKTS